MVVTFFDMRLTPQRRNGMEKIYKNSDSSTSGVIFSVLTETVPPVSTFVLLSFSLWVEA